MKIVHEQIRVITRIHPWIGRVLNRLPKVFSETLPNGSPCPTMATNGKAIFISPTFVDSLSVPHIKGILVHEAIHVIQRHPLRRGNRDPEMYGIAIDAATNALVENLYYDLPDNKIEPVRGKTVEQIYADLAKNQPEQDDESNSESDSDSPQGDADGNQQGNAQAQDESEPQNGEDSGGDGQPGDESNSDSDSGKADSGEIPSNTGTDDCMDYPLEPGETMQDAERAIDGLMAEAELDAKLAGDSPSDSEREIFQHRESDLNWPRELEEYVHLIGGADYSMNPPHMGLGQQGIICNQLNPKGCGNVVLAVDTSGSINRDKLDLAISHLTLFVENMDYESIRVIACSFSVKYDRTFYRGETVDISDMRHGGGTRFMPVFDLIDEGTAPDLLIYFTDMQTNDMTESEDPGYPIIWLVDNESSLDEYGEWADMAREYWFTPDYGKAIDACQ